MKRLDNPRLNLDDEFIQKLTQIDSSIAENVDSRRDESTCQDDAADEMQQLEDCLRLIQRVREHSPDCMTDLIQDDSAGQFWLDGGDDCPARIGRFEIRRKLGQGGFGLVFLAFDPQLQREVALKVPRVEALVTQQTRDRFLSEGKTVANLNHANIAAVFEAGAVGPVCYITSVYCAGGSLADLLNKLIGQRHFRDLTSTKRKRVSDLRRNTLAGASSLYYGRFKQCGAFQLRNDQREGLEPTSTDGGRPCPPRLPFRAAASLVRSLAEAVQHAHSRGILHRDLKPANILFDTDALDDDHVAADGFGNDEELAASARIVDFGLAKAMNSDPQLTRTGTLLGTPAYISPEQAEGSVAGVGPACDIYSLGAILYELLAGRPPHAAASDVETIVAVKTKEPLPPRRINRDCPPDLEAICLKCLEKSPADRYRSATDLSGDLNRFLNGQPVTARPVTGFERGARWARRNPVLSSLTVIVILLLITMGIGSTTAALLLARANREAQDQLAVALEAKERETTALYRSYQSEARALLTSIEAGRRAKCLEAVSEAAKRIEQLGFGREERRALRNSAIAGMGLVDLQLDKQWDAKSFVSLPHAMDWTGTRYAYADRSETIVVRRMEDNQEIARICGDFPGGMRKLRFSPDRKYLVGLSTFRDRRNTLRIWRLFDLSLIHESRVPFWRVPPMNFAADGTLAVARPDGSIDLLKGASFEMQKKLAGERGVGTMFFSRDSSRLAVCRSGRIEILDVADGGIAATLPCRMYVRDLSWSHDDCWLAAACGSDGVFIWDIAREQRVQTLKLPIQIVGAEFHPDRDILATRSYDTVTRLWDWRAASVLVQAPGHSTRFTRDGRWLGKKNGRWQVVLPEEHRAVEQPRLASTRYAPILSFHPSGRLMAASNAAQTVLWDVQTMHPVVATLAIGANARFDPTGKFLVSITDRSLVRRPVELAENDNTIEFQIGPREKLAAASQGRISISADGRSIAYASYRHSPIRIGIYHESSRAMKVLTPHHRAAYFLDMSADGRWLATGAWHGQDVRIWNARSGELAKTIASYDDEVKFSPDGRTLVIDGGSRYSVWNVNDWTPLLPWTSRDTRLFVGGGVAFSPDGRVLAIRDTSSSVKLLDTSTFSKLATLQLSDGHCTSLAFSPDGSRLAAGTTRESSRVHVWNLRKTRRWLKRRGLDWDHPPLPEPPQFGKTLSVIVAEDDPSIGEHVLDSLWRGFRGLSDHLPDPSAKP